MIAGSHVLAIVLAAIFLVHGALMILAVPVMRAGAASVGFTVAQYRAIGLLEVAASAGLTAGLAIPSLGLAAAAGVAALMIAAVVVHHRARDPFRRMLPALLLGSMAIAYIALLLHQ